MNTAAPAQRFANINLLRALAAVAVVVYHVIEHGKWTAFPVEGPLVGFRLGWLGVDLFFVISGFVIGYSALVLYRAAAYGFAREYWRRRLARIVPLYVLTLVLWIPFAWPGLFAEAPQVWLRQLLTHLTFTHNLRHDTFGSMDGPNWSLGVEMQFYLLVALAIAWIDRTPGWRIWCWGIAIAWAWRAGAWWMVGSQAPGRIFEVATQLPGTLDEFGAGLFLAKHVLDRPTARAWHGLAWTASAIGAGAIAMALYWPRATYWNHAAMVVFWRTAVAAFFLCIVAAAVRLPQFVAHRALAPIDFLGEASYGIYLWHLFAVMVALQLFGAGSPAMLAATLAGTVALATLSWRYFEQPILRLARSKRAVAREDRAGRGVASVSETPTDDAAHTPAG